MKLFAKQIGNTLTACVLGIATLHSAVANATIDIADAPLFMGIQADPNIMFILDDSGSMHWEYMPDELRSSGLSSRRPYVFPQPRNIYGSSDYVIGCGGYAYRYFTPTFEDNNVWNLRFRSPQHNKVFYNPDIEYGPWYNDDGTQMSDANPRAAYYNPADTSKGTMDLTVTQTMASFWFKGTSLNSYSWHNNYIGGQICNGINHTFTPITYYLYNGGSQTSIASYTKVQITSSTSASATFTSPNGTVRTRDEEIQNFANWFSFYRSRVLSARSGVGAAFATQGEDLRVGFGTINKGSSTVDGVSTRTVINGVRPFSGADRTSFYSLLYGRAVPTSGTPLRRALDAAGKYYSRTDNRGPWGAIPGTNNTSSHIECRKSYSILMTDGYWSEGDSYDADTSAARQNNDNADGSTHTNPDSDNYIERADGSNYNSYKAVTPFKDSTSDTLADVAMYYWKNDLRPDLENKIVVRPEGDGVQDIENPAYWQHMITFGVGLGVTGSKDPDDAYQAVKDNDSLSWSSPFGSNPSKIDDLLHASINSRGGFFSAGNPEEFAAELKNVLDTISSDVASSSSAVANTTRLDTETLVYQAKFAPDNWSGQLLAYSIEDDGTVDTDDPEWDADDELPVHTSRKIYTYIPGSGAGTGGVEFQWANLTANQQADLNIDIFGATDNLGERRVAFLRGDTSQTGTPSVPFRNRVSDDKDDPDGFDVLGDIINSDPIFVGSGDFGYGAITSALPTDEKLAYRTFRADSGYLERDTMIYIGANDGMFHGINAKTGKEEFAFIPNALFSKLSALTSPDYTHQYYVDATPHMGDAYINSNWKTVVTSTLGAGGRALFAIDVTDPDSVGGGDILWEVEADDSDADLKHMGYMLGKPQIIRAQGENGKWLVVVGNGYNSADHQAALLVLDAEDGSVIKVINTGVGSASEPNGLSTPFALDLNGDKIAETLYAGDMHGNLWKFDFSSEDESDWDIAIKGPGNSNEPLFQACDGACSTAANRQPITVKPTVVTNGNGVTVLFGTGKYFADSDASVGSSPRTEAFYGIYDCGHLSNATLCGTTVDKSELVQQSIIAEDDRGTTNKLDDDVRATSDEDVTLSSSEKGWYMDLIPPGASNGGGERVVANPVLVNDAVLFVTFTPDVNPCNFGGSSWLMELQPRTGARFDSPILDANGDGIIDENDYIIVGGKKVFISGTREDEKRSAPGVLYGVDGGVAIKIFSGSSGNINIEKNLDKTRPAGRQSWRQLR